MNKAIISSGLLLLVVLLVLVLVIGCVPEEVAPPEEKVIKIGNLCDLTGPYSTIGVPIMYGHNAYFNYINDTEGGINGIPVEVMWGDCKSNAALAISLYRRFKEAGIVAMISTTSTEVTATLGMLDRDRIPCCGTSTSVGLVVPPRAYYNTYEGAMALQYATQMQWYYGEWQKKGLDRPMRIGIITWDNPLGRDGWEGVKRWVERQPAGTVEIVAETFTSPLTMDYTTELTVLKAKEVDVIVNSVSGGAHGMVNRDAARVGLSEDIPIINQAAVHTVGNIELAAGEVGRGMTASLIYYPWEATPGTILVEEMMARYHPGMTLTLEHYATVRNSMTLAEVIRIALDRVGYENLTGQAIMDGFDSIKDFDNMRIGCPQTFGEYPGDRIGMTATRIIGWDADKSRPKILTDWIPMVTLRELGYFE